MNKNIEQLTGETCVHKVYALRAINFYGKLEKCRNCSGEYYELCEQYKPLKNTQLRYAYLNLYRTCTK